MKKGGIINSICLRVSNRVLINLLNLNFMSKTLKQTLLFIAAVMTGVIVTSCNNVEDDMMQAQQDATQVTARSVGTKTPKLTVYIETNDINPLNAGE